MTDQTTRKPDGAWGHAADPSMMSAADDSFCQSCGEDHSVFDNIVGLEHVERCKVCGRWEHIAVDGQMGNWPGAERCFECWFKMPLRKRIAWIRWTMTDWRLLTGPTPDELEARQLSFGQAT